MVDLSLECRPQGIYTLLEAHRRLFDVRSDKDCDAAFPPAHDRIWWRESGWSP